MICAGCGGLTTESRGGYIRCIRGSWTRLKAIRTLCGGIQMEKTTPSEAVQTLETVRCACGCGETIVRDRAKRGRRRKYLRGHSPCVRKYPGKAS